MKKQKERKEILDVPGYDGFAALDSEELSRLGKLSRWRSPRHHLQAGAAGRELGLKGWEGRKSSGRGALPAAAGRDGVLPATPRTTAGKDGTFLQRTEPSASPYVTFLFWICFFLFSSPPLYFDIWLGGFSLADSWHFADPLLCFDPPLLPLRPPLLLIFCPFPITRVGNAFAAT